MLLPLGILASASGGAADYELISTTLVTSAVASVTFSSLNAATYKHLQFRITERSSASVNSQLYLRFNGDTGANYSEHLLAGGGSGTMSTYGGGSVNFAPMGSGVESGNTANLFTTRIIDILDFSSASKNTTVREFYGFSGSASKVGLYSSAWYNTAAVTSILVAMNAGNIEANSRISLYGLKG